MKMIESAKTQYRAAFRSMASGGTWHLYRRPGTDDVILCEESQEWVGEKPPVFVANVETMTEARLVQAIHDEVRGMVGEKIGYLKKDHQEKFNLKNGRFVTAWRIVDASGEDMVQPWCRTKREARDTAKNLGIKIAGEVQ